LKILITGGNGQVGMCLRKIFNNSKHQTFFYSRNELDITNMNEIDFYINKCKPDVIINAAAYTNVDKAESDSINSEKINSFGPKNLAQKSFDKDILLIHISTDYVFDGSKNTPYHEDDGTNPQTAYGIHKLLGENNIIKSNCRYIILRTSWVYSEFGSNFLKTMIELGKKTNTIKIINDQFGNPTSAHNIARLIAQLIDSLPNKSITNEIFHYCGEKEMTWYGFAKSIFRNLELNNLPYPRKIISIQSSDYPTPAKRPKNSRMSSDKINNIIDIKGTYFEKDIDTVIKNIF